MKNPLKMKKILSILSVITLVVIGFSLNSCVKDSDYETPQINCEEPQIDATQLTSIDHAIEAWNAINPGPRDANPYEFAPEDASPVYLSGYVISSDKEGNFYKELYIQNDPANPTKGVKLLIDQNSLFTKYNLGRKIYVQLNGKAINKSHGEFVIGELDNNNVSLIRKNVAKKIIRRSCETPQLQPKVLNSVDDIRSDMIGTYVQFNDMQFVRDLLGKTFVDPNDSYDSQRKMVSCADEKELMLETSTFASFKDNLLPEGSGSVSGILSRDYRDRIYVLRVNSPKDVNFDGPRCDPPVLECNNANVGGSTVVFEEDFQSYSVNDTNLPGWTNVNVSGGSKLWQVKEYSGNKYMQISAYRSGENPMEVWLITPGINLDNSAGEELSFKTKTGYNNGKALSVFVSTDYTGNPADIDNATWLIVDADIANGPSSGYMTSFVEGKADISCLDGTVYIAFRYLGGDGAVTTTYQLDDVKVSAN